MVILSFYFIVICGVVLVLPLVIDLSFIAESTTVVPMSHGYGGYQTATSQPNYTRTQQHTQQPVTIPRPTCSTWFYTTKAQEYYTTTYAAPAYYTEAPKHYSTWEFQYYATTYAPPAYYTEAPKYYSAPAYYTKVLNTTLHPATYPQLRRPSIMQYLLTTQRLLHRTTLIWITTPRFQLTAS
jgi:hypothetical protein